MKLAHLKILHEAFTADNVAVQTRKARLVADTLEELEAEIAAKTAEAEAEQSAANGSEKK